MVVTKIWGQAGVMFTMGVGIWQKLDAVQDSLGG